MKSFGFWFTALMLVIFVVMTVMALDYPPGAQFMPLLVGIPGIILCVAQLVQDYLVARKGAAAQVFSAPRAGEPVVAEATDLQQAVEPEFGPETVKAEVTMWVYLLVFIAGLLFLGYVVTVPIMLVTYLVREAQVKLVPALIAAAICTGLMYVFFEVLFRLHLHPGFITASVLKSLGFQ